MAWSYSTCDDELTMMPMKLTIEKPSGTETSCGHTVADGYVARDAKSGAFLSRIVSGLDGEQGPAART